MSKFYFHLRNLSDEVLAPEGVECANADVVASKALEAARDIISQDARDGTIDMCYRIDVEDSSNRVVHTIKFEDAVAINPSIGL